MTFSTSAVAVCCCSASPRSSVLRLHLVEQPRILDRDRRLIGEILDELDLARHKGFGLGTAEAGEFPTSSSCASGDHHDFAIAGQFGCRLVKVVGIVPGVVEMRDFTRTRRPARVQGVADRDGVLAGLALERLGQAELRNEAANLTVPKVKGRERGATEFWLRPPNSWTWRGSDRTPSG